MSHVDPFNAVGGFSVGIPPELVIDENGNVVNNVNAPNSNVTANRVFANAYFYANGNPLSIGASGANTQVQYNNNGLLGASSAFTFNSATNLLTVTKLQVGSNANLGNVANVVILGGTNGYFLQTDGAGNLTWASAGNGGNTGNGIPGGANTQVQFNDAGQFGGDAGFTYNKTTNVLAADNIGTGNIAANYIVTNWDVTANVVIANYLYGDGSNISNVSAVSAATANSVAGANVTGQVNFAAVANSVAGANVTGQVGFANVANNVAGANVSGQVANALVAGTVYTSAQPNITSVGNLTSLTVIGNTTLGNQVVSNYFIGNLFGLANLARNVTLASQPNITSLGTLTSLTVSGNTTLGNTVTGNYFVGNLYGVANSAIVANLANVATIANLANVANIANYANFTNYTEQSNIANVAYSVSGSNVVGQVANALVAGTVYTNAQPNITSLGTLTNLDVSANISAGNIMANVGFIRAGYFVGPLATAAQPNITSLGNLTTLTVVGQSNLGNVGNVKITGGTNGYVLSTDGTGNLSWVAQGNGGGGNGTPGGSNTQIQFNLAGTFGASPNLTWNDTSRVLFVGGTATFGNQVSAASFVSNTVTTNSLTVTSNITAGNVNGGNLVSANYISGILTTNSQLNIHYLGNVGWLNVDTSIPNANGNITFNGTLRGTGAASDIITTGNVDAGNYVQANYLIGVLTTGNQPNITNIGNLSSLTVVGQSNLGNVGNVKITGGNANYVLSTDGTGNLSWVAQTGGGNGTPAGNNTFLQYNDNGAFGGDANLTWNKLSRNMFVGGGVNANGVITAIAFTSNTATGSAPLIVTSTTPVANLGVETAATVRNAAQPNITSVGTLSNLTVSGTGIFTSNLSVSNTFNAGNITTPGTIGTTNLNVTGTANFSNTAVVSGSGTLNINGKLNTAGASNVWLGNIANLHISGGINGYVLATDGNANLYWTAGGGGGGNGTPGGSNTQIQYNNNGLFAGDPAFTFDAPNAKVTVAGNLVANALAMGAGSYQFSYSNVYFATTNSSSEQVLLSIEADDIAAVDYTIISTDGSTRNFIKISTVIIGSSLNYVEYSTLPLNGYTGDFSVNYFAGNVMSPASIQLKITPQSSNLMSHKMMVTTYKE